MSANEHEPQQPQKSIDSSLESLGAEILRNVYDGAIGSLETARDAALHVRTHNNLISFLREQSVAEALRAVIFAHPDARLVQLHAPMITGPGTGARIPLLPEGIEQPKELSLGKHSITPSTSLGDVMIIKTPSGGFGRKSSIVVPSARSIEAGLLSTSKLAYSSSFSVGPFNNIAAQRELPFITHETPAKADEAAESYAEGLQVLTSGVLDTLAANAFIRARQ